MDSKRIVSIIALSLFLTACGSDKGAAQQPVLSSAAPSLVVLGDSLSAGQYLPGSEVAFPRLLANDLHALLSVYAVAGHTTAQTRSMYTGELAPTYAVIELGTNDYNRGIPLATFTADYQDVVASIRSPAREVCLSVWDPVNSDDAAWSNPLGIPSPVNRVGVSPAAYNAIIARVCHGTYLSLQALYDTAAYHGSGTPGALYHPNVAGDAAIAQLIYSAL